MTATPARNAVNVAILFHAATEVLGAPQLTVTYSGHAPRKNARVLAQIVDDSKHVVLGGQLTPIPVVLDGQQHTLTLPLEILAATAKTRATFTLQLVAQSTIFNTHPAGGTLNFSRIKISVPTTPYPRH